MPSLISSLVPKAAKASVFSQDRVQAIGRSDGMNASGVPDATRMREWRDTVPLVARGISWRRRSVAGSSWVIVSRDRAQPIVGKHAATRDRITQRLSRPNPKMKNNSFAGLLDLMVDDMFCCGFGSILKHRLPRDGSIAALEVVDSALVDIENNWDGDPTSPRYWLRSPSDIGGTQRGKPLLNSDLITIVLNPATYSETGIPPLRILNRTLSAYLDLFKRVQTVQKHGGPASWINIAGAGTDNIMSIARRITGQVEGNSSVMLTDFDIDDVKYQELGTSDLVKSGTFSFHDILVREIAAVLDVAPIYLMQEMHTHLSSAREQGRMTVDEGLPPLLSLIAGYIDQEVILDEAYGDETLQFSFRTLEAEDDSEGPDAVRAVFGPGGSWTGINDALRLAGLDPITQSDVAQWQVDWAQVQPWLQEPRVVVAEGGVALPISQATAAIEAKLQVGAPAAPAPPPDPTPPAGLTASIEQLVAEFDTLYARHCARVFPGSTSGPH